MRRKLDSGFVSRVRDVIDADFSLEELLAEAEQVSQVLGSLSDSELRDRANLQSGHRHRTLEQRHSEGRSKGHGDSIAQGEQGGQERKEFGAEILDFVFPSKTYACVKGGKVLATSVASKHAVTKPADEFSDMTQQLKGLFASSSVEEGEDRRAKTEQKWLKPVQVEKKEEGGKKQGQGGDNDPSMDDCIATLLWFTDLCAKRDYHSMLVNIYSIVVGGNDAARVAAELFELLGDTSIEIISELSQRLEDLRKKLKVVLLHAYRRDQESKKEPRGDHRPGSKFSIVSEREQEIKKSALKASKKKSSNIQLSALLSWLQGVGIDGLIQIVTSSEEAREEDVKDPNEFDLDDYVGKGKVTLRSGLPPNAVRKKFKNHEEVFVPAQKNDPGANEPRVQISELEKWAQLAFKGYKELNRIQSKIFHTAYFSNENLLVCAPTGAGKTNIAMISVLHEVKKHMTGGMLDDSDFKIVYIAPMKALAAEVTATFSKRLEPLGINVKECTGDIQLSKREMSNTQMIVTTPEKWDVITRKGGDVSAAAEVRLLILDEVHLLNDERGAVIETLVARTQRQVEVSQSMIRIVGLSATLPSYKDVASFLGVNVETGLFYFDHTYRPVPLDTFFFGVNENNFAKREHIMNEIAFEKAIKSVQEGYQVMVFVHSRKKTAMGGRAFVELAAKSGYLDIFDADLNQSQQKELQKSKNKELNELVPKAIATHHAGMLRSDRNLAEKLFREGKIKVLFCTATLAWGVNLPVHTVIIKGTQVYDANKGGFNNIGILDVLQIFGRAGRPQYDSSGEAMIITTDDQLHHYIGAVTNQVPIESKFVSAMVDNLNAEIVLGTVTNMREACIWLSYTYLFTRMKKNPLAYGITWNAVNHDPSLSLPRREIVTNAARTLHECKMTVFDQKSGNFYITELGRIASLYYLKHSSVSLYNEKLHPHMSEADVIEMISQSAEFENISVREDEVDELSDLMTDGCPIDVRGGPENAHGKINILLQCYVSRTRFRSFALTMDAAYVADNAPRICRALFELCLKRGWCSMSELLLNICKALEHRCWSYEHSLRQFSEILKPEILYKLEKKNLTVGRLRDMSPQEIGSFLRHSSAGHVVKKAIEMIPQLELGVKLHPITRSVLQISLTIVPLFRWDSRLHHGTLKWWVWVEDQSNEHIYHSEVWMMTRKICEEGSHTVSFTIPIFEPLPPQYYIRVISDEWIGSEAFLEMSFRNLILPERHPAHTQLLDLDPLPLGALQKPSYESLYETKFTHFNPIQTQVFHTLYHTDKNVLLGAPTGSGKTICSELAIFRAFNEHPGKKIVYIAPLKALVKERVKDWRNGLCKKLGKKLVELTGDFTPDLQSLLATDLIVSTPEKWDGVSRSWSSRAYVKSVCLVVFDEIHLLGGDRGPIIEVIVSRMRYIAQETLQTVRLVGLSTALANARDLADWMGIPKDNQGHGEGLFNFRPSVRPVPLECHIQGYSSKFYCPRMATMNKPAYAAIQTHSLGKPVLVFVSSRRQTRITANDIITHAVADEKPKQMLNMQDFELEDVLEDIHDSALRHTLQFGIGLHHAGLSQRDREIVEELYVTCKIQVLVCTSTLAWGMNFPTHLVIIKGTEYFDAKEKRYVDFPITDVLQMMGRAGRPQFDKSGVAVIMVHEPKKSFYKKFLYEPFPVESSLADVLQDHVNAEIASGTVSNKQDVMEYLTWTYFFRRIMQNPTYYGLESMEEEDVTEFLSDLIEDTLEDLEDSGCISILNCGNETEIESLLLGKVSSFYYLSYKTAALFGEKIHEKMSLQETFEVLCAACEYDEMPVRHNEDLLNAELAEQVMGAGGWEVNVEDSDDPHFKVNVMFQAYFSRLPLPVSDYALDTKSALDQSIRIIQAMIDVATEKGWLTPVLNCILLLQMLSQGAWYTQPATMTLPFVSNKMAKKLPTLPKLVWYSRDFKRALGTIRKCGLPEKRAAAVTKICSSLPLLDVKISKKDGKSGSLAVELCKDNFKKGSNAYAPRFPKVKQEGWYVVLAAEETNKIHELKRVSFHNRGRVMVNLNNSSVDGTAGKTKLLVCSDTYLGLDQELSI
ncbi:Sec63 domain-containing protein [Chloropicon primus]|uniref:Sec63 domain-containing protein n=3 Tax=Chloropicon primus TaxID=1764295 RepID=A0A5B8MWG2_9CHLO|nr:Sec63 domain-containing protein [Chloropicon primus]|eukprot:QDZ24777.1 Sec63 domain-containing protein [Chloropicon primus]